MQSRMVVSKWAVWSIEQNNMMPLSHNKVPFGGGSLEALSLKHVDNWRAWIHDPNLLSYSSNVKADV